MIRFLALVLLIPSFALAQIAQKEDFPAKTGDYGALVLGVRNDSNTALTSTDGDYSALAVDSAGRLKSTYTAGDPTTEATYAFGSLAFGSITGSYATLLTDANAKLLVDIVNTTDAAIFVSFDATNNHQYVAPNSSLRIPLGSHSRKESSNISIKHTGTAPTVGTVYAAALY